MDTMPGMGHGGSMAAPPPSHKKRLVMHMEFFWGTVTEVLFDNWPGTKGTAQYVLSLVFVFALAVLLEGVARLKIGDKGGVVAGALRTAVHVVRTGLSYLVMLAVMSFNGGVFLAVVAGHAVGFVLFGKAGGDARSEGSAMAC